MQNAQLTMICCYSLNAGIQSWNKKLEHEAGTKGFRGDALAHIFGLFPIRLLFKETGVVCHAQMRCGIRSWWLEMLPIAHFLANIYVVTGVEPLSRLPCRPFSCLEIFFAAVLLQKSLLSGSHQMVFEACIYRAPCAHFSQWYV
jgi:hypothetical protein